MQNSTHPTSNAFSLVLGLTDVARQFGVTRQTVHGWVRKGTIPAPKRMSGSSKGKCFWSPDDIREALARRNAA